METGERRTYWNWGENFLELGKGERAGTGERRIIETGERRTYWSWGKDHVQELGRGEL